MRPRLRTKYWRSRASTLVELVVSLTALAIVLLGHGFVGYYTRLDIRRSMKQSTAATTAQLLCESWAGVQGAATYDPTADLAGLLPLTTASGPGAPTGFTSRGSYALVLDGTSYYATLSSQDLGSALRALNVTIAWSGWDGADSPPADKLFRLTTYVLLD